MVEAWFALLCVTLIAFAALDGMTIGAGIVHLRVARTAGTRRDALAALGPLWSWNEVWLVAAGGTLILAFPRVMGVAFAGFYLALWLVLWSLILRGIAIEVRDHQDEPLWHAAWDFLYASSSVVLAVLFGAAIGAVIRGVPLDATGRFSLSLFTDFRATGHVGLLDWYTLSTAAFTTILLAAHGATALACRTSGHLQLDASRTARRLWRVVAVLFPMVSVATWIVRPDLLTALTRPAALAGMIATGVGAAILWRDRYALHSPRASKASTAFVAALLVAAAAAVFPVMLRSTLAPEHSITAYAGASPARTLQIGLWWWPVAGILALAYAGIVTRGYARNARG